MLPLRDHNPSQKKPIITTALIAANLLGFLFELASENIEGLVNAYALVPAAVDFGNPAILLPFLTSMFLHAGWFHLISNMWFLWIFGDNVEERFGKLRYLLFYVFSGIAAGLAQYLANPQSAIPMLGASGAVAGVLGAYLVFFPRAQVDTLVPLGFFARIVPLPAFLMLGYWFVTQVFSGVGSLVAQTAATGGIAFFAHAGGFAAGAVLAALVKKVRRPPISVRFLP